MSPISQILFLMTASQLKQVNNNLKMQGRYKKNQENG
jgi:hypothetical protein